MRIAAFLLLSLLFDRRRAMFKLILIIAYACAAPLYCTAQEYHELATNFTEHAQLMGPLRFKNVEGTTRYIQSFPAEQLFAHPSIKGVENVPQYWARDHTALPLNAYMLDVELNGTMYKAELYYYLFDSYDGAEWWTFHDHAYENGIRLFYPDNIDKPGDIGDNCFYGVISRFIYVVRRNCVFIVGARGPLYDSHEKLWDADANVKLARIVDSLLVAAKTVTDKSLLPTPRIDDAHTMQESFPTGLVITNVVLDVTDPMGRSFACVPFLGSAQGDEIDNEIFPLPDEFASMEPKLSFIVNEDNYVTVFYLDF